MRMNALIPLQGQYADPVGAFARGQGARAQSDEYAHLNALRGAYKQHGGAAMQGDGNALAAIAQYDFPGAMDARTAQHGMEIDNQRVGIARESLGIDRERLGIARQEAARLARAEAANISAAERAREFEKAKMAASGLEVVLRNGDPAMFDVWKRETISRFGDLADDLEGATIDTAPVILSILQGSAEGLMPAEREGPLSPEGKLAADIKSGYVDPPDPNSPEPPDVEGEGKLRQEFGKITQDFRDISDSYRRIEVVQDTSQGDIALIFNYMKMLDPGSTVREGEFATAEQTGGVPAYIRNLYNKARTGERLTPEQRKGFRAQAEALFRGAEQDFTATSEQYKMLADEYGFTPERVVVPYGSGFADTELPPEDDDTPPPELISQLAKSPPGTRVQAPDGRIIGVWDGEKVVPAGQPASR